MYVSDVAEPEEARIHTHCWQTPEFSSVSGGLVIHIKNEKK